MRKKGAAAVKEEAAGGATWRDEPVQKRIEHALVKGIDTYIVKVRLLCLLYVRAACAAQSVLVLCKGFRGHASGTHWCMA